MSQSWNTYHTPNWKRDKAIIQYGIFGDMLLPPPKRILKMRISIVKMVAQNVPCPMRSCITDGRRLTLSMTVMPPYDQRVLCRQSIPRVSGTTVHASELTADLTLHPAVFSRAVIS